MEHFSESTKNDGWWGERAVYLIVNCRFCGEAWKFPAAYSETFKDARLKWECPACRNKIVRNTVFGFFDNN